MRTCSVPLGPTPLEIVIFKGKAPKQRKNERKAIKAMFQQVFSPSSAPLDPNTKNHHF